MAAAGSVVASSAPQAAATIANTVSSGIQVRRRYRIASSPALDQLTNATGNLPRQRDSRMSPACPQPTVPNPQASVGTLFSHRGCVTLRALRCRVVHWRFQALVDAYPKLGASTVEDVWEWSLQVEREIREVLGVDSDAYDTMREVRHLMRVVDIQPWRRRHKDYLTDEVFGPIRARTYTALMAAASEDQEDRMVVRVVDLHPWIAEAAEPLFDDGHRRQAIVYAAQNLEKQWRELLGVATPSLSQLAQESFSANAPAPEHPRLRYPAAVPGCRHRHQVGRLEERTYRPRWSTPKAAPCASAT